MKFAMFRTRAGAFSGADVLLAAAALTVACAVAAAPIAAACPDPPNDNTSCPAGELDNCYNRDQMRKFVEVGERMVIGYLTQIGVSGHSLPTLTYIPSASSASSQCVDQNGNDTQHDRSFDYCPTDNTVYIGQISLWDFYRQYGAAGPISGLAHEYGHFLQAFAGVPDPTTATETIRHEDQADCVSGAFINYLDDRGVVEYPEDFDNVGQYLTATASAEGPGRDHGTADERTQSFELGYTGALPACNQFFPATPLAT
jgi:Putative neutral zinc metallopeptidase